MSSTWARPGESWALGIESGEWEDLLERDNAHVRVVEQIKDKQGVSSSVVQDFVAKTNIFRWEIEMSMNPAGRIPDKVRSGCAE